MAHESPTDEELIAEIKNAAGIIRAVTENCNWIEDFFRRRSDAHAHRQYAGRQFL
jgi:hypothetical protein